MHLQTTAFGGINFGPSASYACVGAKKVKAKDSKF